MKATTRKVHNIPRRESTPRRQFQRIHIMTYIFFRLRHPKHENRLRTRGCPENSGVELPVTVLTRSPTCRRCRLSIRCQGEVRRVTSAFIHWLRARAHLHPHVRMTCTRTQGRTCVAQRSPNVTYCWIRSRTSDPDRTLPVSGVSSVFSSTCTCTCSSFVRCFPRNSVPARLLSNRGAEIDGFT